MTLSNADYPARPIDPRHLARVEGWGRSVHSLSHLHRPTNLEGIRAVFQRARDENCSIALRGGGNSYGDAAINEDGMVLDLSAMNRILEWDVDSGLLTMEPGVTIEQMWKHIIGDGWWPTVVSGTMKTTAAGCAAMNIHGKNNFKVGTFGDNIRQFDILLPGGEIKTCSRNDNSELFHAAIGGFGMLGCFTRIQIQTKKVHSGLVRVEAFNTRNLTEMVEQFERRVEDSDYLVGWVDCIKGGRGLGRGVVHQATYLQPDEDARPADTLTVAAQDLPSTLFGIFPKSMMYLGLGPFTNNLGMRLVNTAKFTAGRIMPYGSRFLQSHAGFAFLLDYVPNWKLAYGPGGLIQYQSFLPQETAVETFEELIRMSKKAGLPSYLGVFKKHRPDPFLLTHALDGYSLAMDFRVKPRQREKLWELTDRMDEVVLRNGGKFYFAKDATLRADAIEQIFPEENLQRFLMMKCACDPENRLQTNLSRRLFSPMFGNSETSGQ